MSGWEQYFEKVVCEERTGLYDFAKSKYPYKYYFTIDGENITGRCVKSPIIYRYRNINATELENDLPMPPTKTFEHMFYGCSLLKNIDALKNWYTVNVEEMNDMFYGCDSLESYPKNLYELKLFTNKPNVNQCQIKYSRYNWTYYFKAIVCEKNTGINKFKYPYKYNGFFVKTPYIYVYRNKNATEIVNNLPMPPAESFEYMFYGCKSLKNIDGLKNWDTRNIKYMNGMFRDCISLTNIDGLKNWDTSNVISMYDMFYNCKSLRNIDGLSNWKIRNVECLRYMFCNCESLKNIDALKNWDTRNVRDIHGILFNCKSLTNIDGLKNWDTKNISDISWSFCNCESLLNIDALKNWDIRNVINIYYMFEGCKLLKSYPKNLDEFKEFIDKSTTIEYWDDVKIYSWS